MGRLSVGFALGWGGTLLAWPTYLLPASAHMDFKAALQAEIEAKKRQINKLKSSNGSSETNDKTKNSVKVADLEKQKQEEYMEKQRTLDDQRQVTNDLLSLFDNNDLY